MISIEDWIKIEKNAHKLAVKIRKQAKQQEKITNQIIENNKKILRSF